MWRCSLCLVIHPLKTLTLLFESFHTNKLSKLIYLWLELVAGGEALGNEFARVNGARCWAFAHIVASHGSTAYNHWLINGLSSLRVLRASPLFLPLAPVIDMVTELAHLAVVVASDAASASAIPSIPGTHGYGGPMIGRWIAYCLVPREADAGEGIGGRGARRWLSLLLTALPSADRQLGILYDRHVAGTISAELETRLPTLIVRLPYPLYS